MINPNTKYSKIGSLFIYTYYLFSVLSIRISNLFIEGLVVNFLLYIFNFQKVWVTFFGQENLRNSQDEFL